MQYLGEGEKAIGGLHRVNGPACSSSAEKDLRRHVGGLASDVMVWGGLIAFTQADGSALHTSNSSALCPRPSLL